MIISKCNIKGILALTEPIWMHMLYARAIARQDVTRCDMATAIISRLERHLPAQRKNHPLSSLIQLLYLSIPFYTYSILFDVPVGEAHARASTLYIRLSLHETTSSWPCLKVYPSKIWTKLNIVLYLEGQPGNLDDWECFQARCSLSVQPVCNLRLECSCQCTQFAKDL